MSKDKKGRPMKDDGNMAQEMAAAGGMGGHESYEPYVFYEFEII